MLTALSFAGDTSNEPLLIRYIIGKPNMAYFDMEAKVAKEIGVNLEHRFAGCRVDENIEEEKERIKKYNKDVKIYYAKKLGKDWEESMKKIVKERLLKEEQKAKDPQKRFIPLEYLNDMRSHAGLKPFKENAKLGNAAYSHSKYLFMNQVFGHTEEDHFDGFTGSSFIQRVLVKNYTSRFVAEKISSGTRIAEESVDLLFSSVYDRHTFLNPEYDEVGIGIFQDYFSYELGNMSLASICGDHDDGIVDGLSGICGDANNDIREKDYLWAKNKDKSKAPRAVIWPFVEAKNILPAIFNEAVDPLPGVDVSGYPISIDFNEEKFSKSPTVESFTVTNGISTLLLDEIVVMNKTNDPNKKFSPHQVAFFPRARLEWGTPYISEVIYTYANDPRTAEWCFQTKTLSDVSERFYRIEDNKNISLSVHSGGSYSFYVVPEDENDLLGNVSWDRTVPPEEFYFMDKNTFVLRIKGKVGQKINFTFQNGQKIHITIQNSDTAQKPVNVSCHKATRFDYDHDGKDSDIDLDDDNDGYSDIDELHEGSNPLDETSSPLDTDKDFIPDFRDTDDDNDGISDKDELKYGLDSLNPKDGQADFDGDGFSNAIEIQMGTNMRIRGSSPIWTPVAIGDVVTFIPSVNFLKK